jgi:hypothetical protein
MIFGGWAIAGLLALAALLSVIDLPGGGGGDSPERLVAAQPRPTDVSRVQGAARTPTPRPERTPTAEPATPGPNPLAALADACDVLRNTPNWQPSDREWFLTNCLGGSRPVPTSAPEVVQPPSGGEYNGPTLATEPPASTAVVPPTATPVRQPDGASVAISMAVQWLRNEAPVTYDADAAECSANSFGGAWVTTCNARLAGCPGEAACVRTIGLCVTLQPPMVTSARSC